MDWYVLQAFSGYENKVKLALEDRIKRSGLQDSFEEILVPTEEVLEIKEGKKKKSERKYFLSDFFFFPSLISRTSSVGTKISSNESCKPLRLILSSRASFTLFS